MGREEEEHQSESWRQPREDDKSLRPRVESLVADSEMQRQVLSVLKDRQCHRKRHSL